MTPRTFVVPESETVTLKTSNGESSVVGPSAKWLAALEATMAVNGYTHVRRSGPGLMTYLLWKGKTS